MAPALPDLIVIYPILSTLAEYVSAYDLFHLGIANHSNHANIIASRPLFERLRRSCICDGRGLAQRQNFSPPYDAKSRWYDSRGPRYGPIYDVDEPIEVRLYNIKCDVADTFPCVRCGVNVCEECRDYERWPHDSLFDGGRPYLADDLSEIRYMVWMCPPCDANTEAELEGKHLSELCDCNVYTRWVCQRCARLEEKEEWQYRRNRIKWVEYEGRDGFSVMVERSTKWISVDPDDSWVWCPCGGGVAQNAASRCMLCKRRHRSQRKSGREQERRELEMIGNPFYDPAYPIWVEDDEGKYPTPYPRLGYLRPGEEEPH